MAQPFEIEFTQSALDDLRHLRRADHTRVLESVDRHLSSQPLSAARNRKSLRPNDLAAWELRIGKLRAFCPRADCGGSSRRGPGQRAAGAPMPQAAPPSPAGSPARARSAAAAPRSPREALLPRPLRPRISPDQGRSRGGAATPELIPNPTGGSGPSPGRAKLDNGAGASDPGTGGLPGESGPGCGPLLKRTAAQSRSAISPGIHSNNETIRSSQRKNVDPSRAANRSGACGRWRRMKRMSACS